MSAKRRRGTSEGKKSKFVLKEKCDTFQNRFARMSFKKEQRGSGGARKRIIMFFALTMRLLLCGVNYSTIMQKISQRDDEKKFNV